MAPRPLRATRMTTAATLVALALGAVTAPAATAAPAPTVGVSIPAAPTRTATHTVVRGDTVYAIARQYGTTPSTIVAANRLANPSLIRVGQVLTVPGTTAPAPVAPRPAPAPAPVTATTHTVVRGDTVYSLARKYGTTVSAIKEANSLGSAAIIHIGQQLRVGTTTTAKPGDVRSKGEIALAWAKTQLGVPYVWGGASAAGYDCSGLTMRAFEQAGVRLPRVSRDQYAASARVPLSQLEPGDLVFYSSNGQPSGIYHLAIYAGNGMRLHAPAPGKSVELVPMYYGNILPSGGRVS